jgi:hypothetical protein
MASGIRSVYRGSFTGTGSQLDVTVVGFRPRSVRLLNLAGICRGEWQETMPDGAMLKTVDSGSGTTDIVNVTATTGITPLANGFRLGADTDLNVSGEIVHFEAEE